MTQYDVELFQRIEQLIGKKVSLFPTVEEEVLALMERVSEAQRYAKMVGEEYTSLAVRVTYCHCLLPQELQSSVERKRQVAEDERSEVKGHGNHPKAKRRKMEKYDSAEM